MKSNKIILILLLAVLPHLYATDLQITEEYFNEDIVVFYLSDFDFNNPAQSPLIFEYRISDATQPTICTFPNPVMISLDFTIEARVPALGWNQYTLLGQATVNPFPLNGPFRLNNRILGVNVDAAQVIYECSEAGPHVEIGGGTASINSENLALLSNVVLATNQLPGGLYRFTFNLYNESEGMSSNFTKTISVSSPRLLNLLNPGSNALNGSSFSAVYTRYPLFQWESDPCGSCNYAIRLAEYIPGYHNSPQQALQDESSLPFPDDGQFYALGNNITMLNYEPSVGGKELEFGHQYVWQVKKSFSTTGGSEETLSEIFGFAVVDPTSGSSGDGLPEGPIAQAIRDIIGETQFNAWFSPNGLLSGYFPTGNMQQNGNSISSGELDNIRAAFLNGSYTIQNIAVE